jgi:gamma-glutamylcyclotransferase (GGCT)/AIG2-like uncharacterized protein YtfP
VKTKQKLYFAYGSNLLRKQMMHRCPHCRYIGLARLAGWKFEYDGICDDWSNMAVGNIVKSPNNEVWGAVYTLCESDINKLDGYEDYPTDYSRQSVAVSVQPSGVKEHAFVYTRPAQKLGQPSKRYEQTILTGARQDGLPEAYVAEFLNV